MGFSALRIEATDCTKHADPLSQAIVMAKSAKPETVPKAMQEKFARITAITDEFATEHLNDEYVKLIRQATAALCRKRPSPLASGREKTWACAISHAVGIVNLLFDPAQTPHIEARDLCDWFGVGISTGQGKSKQVRDMLDMRQMDPKWCLPSLIDRDPTAWLISIDGMILDARTAPRDVQEALATAGLIPYVPGEDEELQGEGAIAPPTPRPSSQTDASSTSQKAVVTSGADALYVLEVNLIDGPMTDEFIDANPQVLRTVEIKGRQTLKELHQAIFKALDREEEHLYEFQIGGRGPNDPNARRYGLKQAFSMPGDTPAGDVAKTSINDLKVSVGEVFGYWFDFGDDWWHSIAVLEIKEKAGKGRYPRVTHQLGASPPQYAHFE